MIITAEHKYMKTGNTDIIIRNILDQLTMKCYGKSISNCVGQRQDFRISNFKDDKHVTLNIPETVWYKAVLGQIRPSGWWGGITRHSMQSYITNIINHAKRNGVLIKVNMT